MKKLFVLLFTALLVGCTHHDSGNEFHQVSEIVYSESQDWCTTLSDNVTFDTENAYKVQLLGCLKDSSVVVLNESLVNSDKITLSYDIPKDNLGVYILLYYKDKGCRIKGVENITRGFEGSLPEGNFTISTSEDSYANKRGWIPGEKLYSFNGSTGFLVRGYNEEFNVALKMLIFSYFKNGRNYNNLPLVLNTGSYNENGYIVTKANTPIIVSSIYKNDGGYQEVINSDLYYYYFNDDNADLESLPKYKLFAFSECIKDDDVLCKHKSYALLYFDENGVGSYNFPEGYKIGFMVRANTTAEGGRKQGELYADGRLNNKINNYGSFKSSKLGNNGPRAAWLAINDKNFMCFESGTDTDFNDIILEIEGGEISLNNPELDYQYYTFCFEDSNLGDYDMNDIVIKARRLSTTSVEYSLVAVGAYDELYIHNIDGNILNNNKEAHELFGLPQKTFINTKRGSYIDPIIDTISVDKTFSFLINPPYIYNKTKGWEVKISKQGEDPRAIMIPFDFKWPLEQICITKAYNKFNEWGINPVISTDWYKYYNENAVY